MGSPYIGEIRMVGFQFAPQGWAYCDGSIVPISENDTLFSLIGTTYGGDGVNTFALPDLRSRVPVHVSSTFTLAAKGGAESVALTLSQLPVHSHPAQCNSTAANNANPTNNYWANWADAQFSDQTPNSNMSTTALSSVGGGQPHDNMLPFLVINFIISLFGIYPSPT